MTVAELVAKLGIKPDPAVWFTTEHDPVTYGEEFQRLNDAMRGAMMSMGAVGRALTTMNETISRWRGRGR